MRYVSAVLGVLLCGLVALSEQKFVDLVGNPQVGKVKNKQTLEVPYLTWGGDEGFFYANGGLETKKGSYYDKDGLKIKFVKGDDFVEQTRRYIKGETPFIRGTMSMMGMASEVCGKNPETTPVVILQLTWSAGDYVVSRKDLKTLNDLKRDRKVKIAVQQGGPHVGLVYEILEAVKLTKNDVELVFVTDLTGPKGPADAFRKDKSIDACCVITPDMIGLTGGMTNTGTGAEGTVSGAHVLVSTQTMSRSIADVLCVRKDWYDNNKATCEKIVAGYLKACVSLVNQRKEFEKTKKLNVTYKATLTQMQNIFGKDILPTLEVDAHGMLLDATFVGLDGNVSFFEDKGNLSGFERKMRSAVDMAVSWGYAKEQNSMYSSGLDYQKIAKLAGLTYNPPRANTGRVVAESTDLFPDSELDSRTILSFVVAFKANQNEFSIDQYGPDFDRAIKTASTFGNAVVLIRGHSDPTKTLVDLIKAGMDKGIITRAGNKGNYSYKLNGKVLDLNQTKAIEDLIKSGAFDGSKEASPRDTMEAALNLSAARAEAAKKALAEYAKNKSFNVDLSQIRPVGAGISQPVVPRPKNIQEAEKNMRVEFRIIRVDAESLKPADFDY